MMADVVASLVASGAIAKSKVRNELMDIRPMLYPNFMQPPLLQIERAAMIKFGASLSVSLSLSVSVNVNVSVNAATGAAAAVPPRRRRVSRLSPPSILPTQSTNQPITPPTRRALARRAHQRLRAEPAGPPRHQDLGG